MSRRGRGTISTLGVILIVGAALLFYRLQIILLPFVVSGLLAYICDPLIRRLASGTRLGRAFSSAVVFVVLVSIVAIVGFMGLSPLLRELTRAVKDIQGTLTSLARAAIGDGTINFLGHSMDASQLGQAGTSAIGGWLGQPEEMLQLGGIAFSTVFGFLLSLVLLFYFLYSGPDIMRGLLWLVPPARRDLVFNIWAELDPVLRRYFVGVVFVVTYAAVAAYIGLGLVLHLPHAAILALLTGFLEIIPMIGPGAAVAITSIVAVRHATGIEAIIGYAIYVVVLRLSIDQLFGPLALGTAAQLHPAAIIFFFITGGVLFGAAGFILAIPVAILIKTCLAVFYGEASGQSQASPE